MIYNPTIEGIILCLILNIFLIFFIKKIFGFFDLNKKIFLFSQKIYDFLTMDIPRVYPSKSLYCNIFLCYHKNVHHML